jgi:hypothetical protein
MEKVSKEHYYKFIKDEEFHCQNIRQISLQIKKIKKKFFDNTKDFTISINFFKKISKQFTVVNLLINHYVFELTFDYSFLTEQTRKEQKRSFFSNLLDELLDNFSGYCVLRVLSDNLNALGNYTLKCLMKENSKVKELELFNTFIRIEKDSNELLKQLTLFPHLEKLTLSILFETLDCKALFDFMDFLFTKTTIKRTNLQVYFKHIDIMSFLDKNLLNTKKGVIINNINELTLGLIKFDPEKSILISDKHRGLIVPIYLVLMNKYWPSFFDFNYYELAKIESNHVFRKINIKYTKDFFFSLNFMKDFILSKYIKKSIDARIFTILSTYSHLSFSNDKMFKPSFMNLGLSFSELKQMNVLKWMFNFIQELEGYSTRKQTADYVIDFLNDRRKISLNLSH